MSSRWFALVAVFLLAGATPGSAAEPCEDRSPDFIRAVNTQGVVGVVERNTLARNPLPWGASVSAATRVWGDIVAERWQVSGRSLAGCPLRPPQDPGRVGYDFRGSAADWEGGSSVAWMDQEVEGAEADLLDTLFGAPVELGVGGADRFMAWVRVAGFEVAVLLAVVATLIGTIWRRRRLRRMEPGLF